MSGASALLAGVPALVERVLVGLGYPGLTLLMVVENVFPPLPSELILPLAGFLVTLGAMDLALVLAAATLGSVLGALVLYGVGRSAGEARVRRFLGRRGSLLGLSEAAYDRGADALRRRSAAVLFWGRFVPGLRSVVSLPAGVVGVPLPAFVLWTALSSLCWNAALVGAGVALGRNWTRVLGIVDHYEALLLAGGAAALTGLAASYAVRAVRRRRLRPRA